MGYRWQHIKGNPKRDDADEVIDEFTIRKNESSSQPVVAVGLIFFVIIETVLPKRRTSALCLLNFHSKDFLLLSAKMGA